jgi:apolipoprotein N-acyltransferase
VTDAHSAQSYSGAAYGIAWRAIAAALVALSRASMPLLLLLVLLANDPPIGPLQLVQLVALFAALPALAAQLIRRAFRAEMGLAADTVRVRRADRVVEIPLSAIGRLAPWAVPLPGSGLSLTLRSGRRLQLQLQLDDPGLLLAHLSDTTGEPATTAARHPAVAYAHARAASPPWRWYHFAGKFVAFPLLPVAVLFNAHQHIAYGGTLGEYYLLGLGAYVETFAIYWAVVVLYLVLYAGTWRCGAELVAWAATWAAPSRAARVRAIVEVTCRLVYYAGVPALLAVRFLS